MMRTKLITASLLVLFVAACGDGNSYRPEGPPPVDMTNIVSIGPITGFGSVVAGGVHYGTGTATVLFDGEPGTLGDLRVGMIVSILGEIDNSTGVAQASEIRFGVDVEGPISSLNPVNSSFVVLGKTVLVTGAGGSIGSELCRQIARLGVKRLLLLDIAEPSLYRVEQDLQRLATDEGLEFEVISLLGSVYDEAKTRTVLATYKVNTIYHAAAYKHVPIVEQNLIEGIRNNALGTYSLAMAACDAGVESFVLISTDKAVRPTSVMGASKRVAELVLQAIQKNCRTTRYSMVRFGNVLESSGSVVPLFREQIRRGGPITVTHREIVRYFMTIQEAAELVIQAGSMAEGGDVFVLDMGEPVKIYELARRMITLAGLTVHDESNPKGDIAIQITGLRPGEKLYEELLVGKNASGTEHPRIMRAIETYIPFTELRPLLSKLESAVQQSDCIAARELLLQLVDSYKPEQAINDLVWQEAEIARPLRQGAVEKVTRISPYRENNKKDDPGAKPDRRDLN